MRIKQKLVILTAVLSLVVGINAAFVSGTVLAEPDGSGGTSEQSEGCDPSKGTCCGKVNTSIIGGSLCGDGGDSSTAEGSAIWQLLIAALKIMTAGVGIAAVGGVGYGALLYATAENKPEQTKRAISIITNVAIGIIAYGLMYVLLNFLVPGGVFT